MDTDSSTIRDMGSRGGKTTAKRRNKNNKKYNKKNDWREDPAFLDATSTVSASTFGARRLPELKSLYFAATAESNDAPNHQFLIHERNNLLSGGGKRSSRHLRRRTTAIQSKKHRHRYPFQSNSVGVKRERRERDGGKLSDDGEDQSSEILPEGAQLPAYKGVTRKSRRKKRAHVEHNNFRWLLPSEDAKDEASNNHKFWLVTHLWHAKRFHLWSPGNQHHEDAVFGRWKGIPLVHTNRGPRAALRLSQNKDQSSSSDQGISSVMVRDVTWEGQPLVVANTRLLADGVDPKTEHQDRLLLLQRLGKICPELSALFRPEQRERLETFFSGGLSLEKTIYEPDSFPAGAIGPAALRMLPKFGRTAAVEIRFHPSIRGRIEEILRQLAGGGSFQMEMMNNTRNKVVPRICFRLYGVETSNVMYKVLKASKGGVSTAIEEHRKQGLLPHGSVISINNVALAGARASQNEVSDDVLLIYRAPRPLDCAANRAIAGWEVHCNNPAFAKALWLALVTLDDDSTSLGSAALSTHKNQNRAFNESSIKNQSPPSKHPSIRGCCAIGLVEDCHMRLECEPPIPLFPRDYIDTEDSHRYWMPSNDSSPAAHSSSWNRVRQLFEGGWGRLPVDKERRLDKLKTIDFRELVACDSADNLSGSAGNPGEGEEATTKSSIVAVRGAFGQPFVDAIQGSCGNYTPKEAPSVVVVGKNDFDTSYDDSSNSKQKIKKRRRNRRPTRPKNEPIIPPPPSRASRIALADYCRRLSSNLSLPAVLLVHVRAVGNGRIIPGMAIVRAGGMRSDPPLGRITAGVFSTSRGVCHGVGVVGAIRLLDYIGESVAADGKESKGENSSDDRHLGAPLRRAAMDGLCGWPMARNPCSCWFAWGTWLSSRKDLGTTRPNRLDAKLAYRH